jgi:hypothetical protein
MSLLGHVKLLYFQRCDMFFHSCALMDNFPGRSSEYHSQLYESTFQCDVMTKMQAQFREQFRLVTTLPLMLPFLLGNDGVKRINGNHFPNPSSHSSQISFVA